MEVNVKSPPAPSTPGPGRPKKLGLKKKKKKKHSLHIYSVLALIFHALGFLLNFTAGNGIWPKIRLGNGIWAKFGLGNGIYTPLQDPLNRMNTASKKSHCLEQATASILEVCKFAVSRIDRVSRVRLKTAGCIAQLLAPCNSLQASGTPFTYS